MYQIEGSFNVDGYLGLSLFGKLSVALEMMGLYSRKLVSLLFIWGVGCSHLRWNEVLVCGMNEKC